MKVAILDTNETYLKKLHNYWSKTYGSTALIVYVFSDSEQLIKCVASEKIDVILLNHQMEIDIETLPKQSLKLYLLPGKKGGELNGIVALPKNGNADGLYMRMMELYDAHMNIEHHEMPGQVVLVTSPIGGCGTTSVAIGLGKYMAGNGKRVLYLNLETINAMEIQLNGNPEKCMDDLFYLCQSNRKNISYSLENMLTKDNSGLYYIAQCKNPLEFQEKTKEDIKEMLTLVSEKGSFDMIIVDKSFILDEITIELMKLTDTMLLITDSGIVGGKKLEHAKLLMEELEHRNIPCMSKTKVIYNKSKKIAEERPNVLGMIPEFGGTCQEISAQIGKWDNFKEIIQMKEE
ncbi:AAA family ATPase [Lachnospiraceae bacterium OttesenSCG-928-D06]|nr:AAA family ATPase [Lachnospiraceae bacterium OttesenSCG-928-D06]